MLQEHSSSALSSSSSESSSSSSSSGSVSNFIQEAKNEIKELKTDMSSSDKMQKVKKKIESVDELLKQIFSEEEKNEKFPMLGFKANLIDKLKDACKEVKKSDEQDIYLRKAITIFFNKLDYLRYLYKPNDFVVNIKDHKDTCIVSLEGEIGSLKSSGDDEAKNKYRVKEKYIDFIFNIAATFFYIVNKLNYLKCNYSIIDEWCAIEALSVEKQAEADKIKEEIDRDINSISNNECKRLEDICRGIRETSFEIKLREGGFKTRSEQNIPIDTSQWDSFAAEKNEFKPEKNESEDKTYKKVITKINAKITLLETKVNEVDQRRESMLAQTQTIQTLRESNQIDSGPIESLLTSKSFSGFKSSQMDKDSAENFGISSKSFLGSLSRPSSKKTVKKEQTFLDSQLMEIKNNLSQKNRMVRTTWQGLYDFFSVEIKALNDKSEEWMASLQTYCSGQFKSSTDKDERCQQYKQEFVKIKKILEDLISELKIKLANLDTWQPDQKVLQKEKEIVELKKEVEQGFQRVNQYLLSSSTSTSASTTETPQVPLTNKLSDLSEASQSDSAIIVGSKSPQSERRVSVTATFGRGRAHALFTPSIKLGEKTPLKQSAQRTAKSWWSCCSIFSCWKSTELTATPTRFSPSINSSGKGGYDVSDDAYFIF